MLMSRTNVNGCKLLEGRHGALAFWVSFVQWGGGNALWCQERHLVFVLCLITLTSSFPICKMGDQRPYFHRDGLIIRKKVMHKGSSTCLACCTHIKKW